MKLLLSSKLLAAKLQELDLEKETVEMANIVDNELILITQTTSVKMLVHVIEFKASVKQDNRRWDWVKDLVSNVEEQPIVLQIFDNIVNVIFQY